MWRRGWVEVWLYSFLTTALEGGAWSAARFGRTLPRERSSTHFTGGWVDPRAHLDGRKISSPPGIDLRLSAPWSVVIPTELPGPLYFNSILLITQNEISSILWHLNSLSLSLSLYIYIYISLLYIQPEDGFYSHMLL